MKLTDGYSKEWVEIIFLQLALYSNKNYLGPHTLKIKSRLKLFV